MQPVPQMLSKMTLDELADWAAGPGQGSTNDHVAKVEFLRR
jgi:hypothetical protein